MSRISLRVLLIEDDEDDYVMVKGMLSEVPFTRFNLDWAMSYDDGIKEVDLCRHDVFLLDYRLGERNGLDFLREAISKGCRIPIIILTGKGDREVDMEAMRAGAADYLLKSQISSDLIERSIRYAIERKKAQEALRQSEKLFRMLVETVNEGLGVQDEDGSFTYVNDKLCRMLQYPREELTGLPVSALFDEESLLILQEEMARRRQGEQASYEVELLAKDGRKVPAIVSSSPIFDEDGNFRGGIAAITDMTTLNECRSSQKMRK